MNSFIFLLFFSLAINISPLLLIQSEKTKNSEIFNIKTDKVYDIEGNLVDLSLYDRVSSIISFLGPNKEHIIIGGLGARDKSIDFPYDDSYFEKNCIIRSSDGGKT